MDRRKPPTANTLRLGGATLAAAGVLLLLSPAAVGGAVVRLVAVVLVVAGLALLALGLRAVSRAHRLMSLALGLVVAAVGVLVWLNPALGSGILTMLLMVSFTLAGAWKLVAAIRFRHAAGWYWLLLAGLVSLAFAWLLYLQYPLESAWAVSVFAGLDLLLTGVALLLLARSVRGARSPDYLETINL